MIDKPGIYEIPATEYHADPCPQPSLSASVARTLIDRSPLHAWMQHPKLGGQQEEIEPARMSLGSAAHSVILEGDWNSIMFIVADSFRTKVAQARRDQIIQAEGIPLLEKDRGTIEGMVAAFCSAGIDRSGMETERTMIWKDKITEAATPIWCRARVDLLGDRLILDLKTTAIPATPEAMGPESDMGLRDAVRILPKGPPSSEGRQTTRVFRFIVQETVPPYSVGQFAFDGAGLEWADYLADQAVWKWSECIKEQAWPSYAAGVNVDGGTLLGARAIGGRIDDQAHAGTGATISAGYLWLRQLYKPE